MKIVEFATRRRVTILMVTVAIVLFGFVSLTRLKLNLLPDLSYPTLTVRTDLPGAAPLELETLVTRPIEESVGIIRNVRSVRSVSRAGQADVILEFAWGTDMDLAGIDVREKIDLLQLPLEASRPILLRFDPSTEPVMRYAFVDTDEFASASPSESGGVERLKSLRRFADDAHEIVVGVAAPIGRVERPLGLRWRCDELLLGAKRGADIRHQRRRGDGSEPAHHVAAPKLRGQDSAHRLLALIGCT